MSDWIDAKVKFETTSCAECQGFVSRILVREWHSDDGLVTSIATATLRANHRRICSEYVSA